MFPFRHCSRVGGSLSGTAMRSRLQKKANFIKISRSFSNFDAGAPKVTELQPIERPDPDGDVPRKGHSAAMPGEVPIPVSFGDISAASFRIRGGVSRTTMYRSEKMSKLLNANVYFKNEFNLPTGSFKERGGRNALMLLDNEAKKRGVIAASAGNHALALSYHGKELGIPVTVVMPTIAPLTKVKNSRELGARVIVTGAHIAEAREFAADMAENEGLTYINGYDDPHIIAGAGTLGIEIVDQVPNVDAIVVPVGGGGLIAGTALAVKSLLPDVQIIGAEPESCPSMTAALGAGKPVTVPAGTTLADGLLVPRVGTNAFAIIQEHVDKTVLVTERFIALSMLRLLEMEKAVVEGGGATGLAAMLSGQLPELEGKNVVIPLCGGNVDTPVLGRVLDRGLAADGRLVRFEAVVSDRPGGIAALTRVLADSGVSIKEILHDRAWEEAVSSVRVKCIVEAADREAAKNMFRTLADKGYNVDMNMVGSLDDNGLLY